MLRINGDIIAYLAENFTNIQFIGVEFSIKNAAQKHKHKKYLF